MRVSNSCSNPTRQDSTFEAFQKRLSGKSGDGKNQAAKGDSGQGRPDTEGARGKPGQAGSGGPSAPAINVDTGGPIPVEPDGGIGDGAGPITLGPVEPGTGDGNGGGAVPIFGPNDGATTLAIGEEDGGAGMPMPVEPDGGIGDGAGPIPGTVDGDKPEATTLAIGEEDGGGGAPMPVEPDGGIGDGAGPIPVDPDGTDPTVTTLAIGEEDGGGGGTPMPVEPDGGIGDGAGPIPGNPGGETIRGTRGNDFLQGTNGDDTIKGRKGDDFITTGQGNDRVRAGKGDDVISVNGTGDKKINGGKGHDTLELKGLQSDYAIDNRQNGSTVYTAADGSRIVARNIESVRFTGVTMEPTGDSDFAAVFPLATNDLGATSLEVAGDTAVLTGPNTTFTFTGVDASGLAADGPIIATGGSGTINGEETTSVPLSPFGPAVLTIGSGFNPTGTQDVSAAFANGDTLGTTVARP